MAYEPGFFGSEWNEYQVTREQVEAARANTENAENMENSDDLDNEWYIDR